MKTSNKVLFGGLGIVLLLGIALAGITRSNSVVYSPEECDKLPSIKKELDFKFESISATQNIELTLKQGEFKVSYTAPEKLAPYINHYVEAGELKLELEKSYLKKGDFVPCRVQFTIQCPDLKQVSVSNGASLIANGVFDTPNLNLRAQNGSWIEMNVQSDEVNVTAQNGANVTLSGEIKYLDAKGVNSSNITAKDADVNKTAIKLSNSAAATIHADTIVRADLVNSSLLKYVGATHLEDVKTVNSSSIERVDN